ncbi:transposable element Tcb1 transposase [Trichonephila clavipes]|nr:transposable element Tcb1 transposase [Trichonephila clavipes]
MPGKRARRYSSQLSEFERGLIMGMKTAGWSTRRVAGQVDRSECAVRNCWEQWTREGTHARKTGSGATMTRSTIRADVGVAIVPQTISRHLAEENLKSKRHFRALPLTPEHQQLRLQWCQARSMWSVTDWQKVVFSDESRFVLGTDDNRVRVWRRPAYDSQSTLIVIRGALTGQRYVDNILRLHVEPCLNGLPGAIFRQDNARPHTARVAQDFLRHFQTLPWPARSPDLSPVEQVWDQLKRQMPSCHSVHDLELAVRDLWAHLPQDNIRGFRGSSIPYEEFQDERGSTSEEVKIEPPISFNCAYCDYRSPTQKGLRCHRITVHKIGVGPTNCYGHALVISASICIACHVSGCLDYKISHISHCLDTIKCTYSTAVQWLHGLRVWSYQLLNFSDSLNYKFGHISHCSSVAVWTTSLVVSVAALQWLFGLQVWSYQSLPGHHQMFLQHCSSMAVWIQTALSYQLSFLANFKFVNCCWDC